MCLCERKKNLEKKESYDQKKVCKKKWATSKSCSCLVLPSYLIKRFKKQITKRKNKQHHESIEFEKNKNVIKVYR